MKKYLKFFAFPVLLIIGLIKISLAYIGPGVGLSALGALLAVIGGVAATIFGLLWYPIKRFLGKRKKTQAPDPTSDEEE
ncbi:MAG: hypothetical protein ACTSQ8_23150 [Candidatus Helarchaeota archaeon]